MKKMVCLIVLLICLPVQATLGDAVDFVTKVTQEYSKKESEKCKKAVVCQQGTHSVRALTGECVKGFVITMAPQGGYLAYRMMKKGLDNPDKFLCVNEYVTLLSMLICAAQGFCVGINCVASDCSRSDVIKSATWLVGSAGAATVLYKLTCLYRQ